jgi:hypothetical protein
MKKWVKVLLWIIATPVSLIVIFMLTYIIMNTQGVIEPFQSGNPHSENKILIASQGSDFKESLVDEIIYAFSNSETFFSVIDCTSLCDVSAEEWDAIIIIHTMQIHKMPAKAKEFLDKKTNCSNIMLVCTSGGGDEIVTKFDVDAISSASRMNEIDPIISWLEKTLCKKQQIGRSVASQNQDLSN